MPGHEEQAAACFVDHHVKALLLEARPAKQKAAACARAPQRLEHFACVAIIVNFSLHAPSRSSKCNANHVVTDRILVSAMNIL